MNETAAEVLRNGLIPDEITDRENFVKQMADYIIERAVATQGTPSMRDSDDPLPEFQTRRLREAIRAVSYWAEGIVAK